MTDYSKMTDEQINEAIFEAKGWYKIRSILSGDIIWIKKDSEDGMWCDSREDTPDYTHDWRLCGELLAEIPNCSLKRWGDKWCCGYYDDNGYLKNQANVFDSPLRAICEAWLDRKE